MYAGDETALIITSSYFARNYAGNSGGAIRTSGKAALYAQNIGYVRNKAKFNGGAISIDRDGSNSICLSERGQCQNTLQNCVYRNNTAGLKGGALHLDHLVCRF